MNYIQQMSLKALFRKQESKLQNGGEYSFYIYLTRIEHIMIKKISSEINIKRWGQIYYQRKYTNNP